jgi:hypothetical protein
MWNEDEKPKKKKINLLSKEELKTVEPPKPIVLMSAKDVFRHMFLESEEIRQGHGFTRRHGRIELIDRNWVDNTIDMDKKEWIRELMREVNGGKK